jgi:hypothetical protein
MGGCCAMGEKRNISLTVLYHGHALFFVTRELNISVILNLISSCEPSLNSVSLAVVKEISGMGSMRFIEKQ